MSATTTAIPAPISTTAPSSSSQSTLASAPSSLPAALSDNSLIEPLPLTISSLAAPSASPAGSTSSTLSPVQEDDALSGSGPGSNIDKASPVVSSGLLSRAPAPALAPVTVSLRLAPPDTTTPAQMELMDEVSGPGPGSAGTRSEGEDAEAVRRRLAMLQTRSLGNLRGTPPVRRERALSDARPDDFASLAAPRSTPNASSAPSGHAPGAASGTEKKSSGFVNFFRRLTGKSKSKQPRDSRKAVHDPAAPAPAPASVSTSTRGRDARPGLPHARTEQSVPRPVPTRQSTAPAPSSAQASSLSSDPAPAQLARSGTVSTSNSVPAKPRLGASPPLPSNPSYLAPLSPTPRSPSFGSGSGSGHADPLRIPLPPSPMMPEYGSPIAAAGDYMGLPTRTRSPTTPSPSASYAPGPAPTAAQAYARSLSGSMARSNSLSPTLTLAPTLSPPLGVGPLGSRSRSASPRRSANMLAISESEAYPEQDAEGEGERTARASPVGERHDEATDVVRPLAPWRINTSRARSVSPGAMSGGTAAGEYSAVDSVLRTPSTVASSPPYMAGVKGLGDSDGDVEELSAEEENGRDRLGRGGGKGQPRRVEEEDEEMDFLEAPMYAGSSPPRKAPIGTQTVELSRKGTKWRRSVMGLSDTLNGGMTRKASTRAAAPAGAGAGPAPAGTGLSHRQSLARGHGGSGGPPSANDAYRARQARVAANRTSCQPTIHSNASIAAQLRGIKDNKEQETAETFFCS